ncbi:SEC-C metal-binding domain-containing protein [Asanoa ishikariensis]
MAAPERGRTRAWPPARNQERWCGSGAKYKTCCLPRSRA